MSEPAFSTHSRGGKRIDRVEIGLENREEEKLGDPVSGMDRIGIDTIIGENDPDFPMVVGVDHAHSLSHPEAML